MSCLVFPKYNQYDTLIVPLTNYLKSNNVNFTYNAEVTNLDMDITTEEKVVTKIHLNLNGEKTTIDVAKTDKGILIMISYITSQFMPRVLGDRPKVVLDGSKNLALSF